VREDLERGRIYLPAEDLQRFAVDEPALRADRASPELRALLRFEVARARSLFDGGAALVRTLSGRARLAVGGFVAGGRAALDAIERCDFDVLATHARPRVRDVLHRLVEVVF